MKKILFTFLIFLFSHHNIYLQNLLPNSSFTDVNICHEYQENCSPKAWRTTGYKSVRYFDYKRYKSRDYNSYINLLLFDHARNFDRKFIQTELLCGLQKNETYKISLRIRPNQFSINAIGVLFLEKMFFAENNDSLKNAKPDILFQIPKNIKQGEWITLEQTFTATGHEKIFMIGNFLSDSLTVVKPIDPKKYRKQKRRSYTPKMKVLYDLDDLSLTAVNAVPDCDLESNRQRIYFDSIRHTFIQLVEKTLIKKDTLLKTPSPILEKKPEPTLYRDTVILNNIEFEFGKAILRTERFPELENIIRIMEENKKTKIEINGHTDNIGTVEDNLKLSEDRAKAVMNYLANKGINYKRMSFIGFGESKPVGDNGTEKGRQANRRVEVIFIE